MKLTILSCSCFLLYTIASYANSLGVPTPPPITAYAYLLQDFHSGENIMAQNIDQQVEIASLTKLMTAYIVFQKLRTGKIALSDRARISEKAWRISGSRMYLEVESSVTVEELLKGMIIQSGNDASIALAEFIAGTEEAFVSLMNAQAQELGLKNTRYANSTGLPEEHHYSSARDLALMAKVLIREFPEYYKWYSEREYTHNDITQHNRNRLLWHDPTVDGMKTGYTDKAGYCLIASAKRGNMRLISIIIGAKTEKARIQESEKMLDYGFRFFETFPLYQAQKPLDTEKVWYGGTPHQVQLGLEETLYVTIPKGKYKQLNASLHIDKHIIAPVTEGKTYGTLKISLNNQPITQLPLVALSSVDTGHLGVRLIDSFLLLFY